LGDVDWLLDVDDPKRYRALAAAQPSFRRRRFQPPPVGIRSDTKARLLLTAVDDPRRLAASSRRSTSAR
jgi:hypothetical protein